MEKSKNNLNHTMDTAWMWGVKGIAVVCIVLYHWFSFFPGGLGPMVKYGTQGAHAFFTLSALGLYLSLLRANRNIDLHWFVKRVLKVLVPYYIAVIIFFLIVMVYGLFIGNLSGAFQQFDLNLQSMLASVFLYRGFIDRFVFVISPAWWFIVAILELYLIFPLLCAFYRRTTPKVFLITTLLVNLFYQYLYAVYFESNSPVLAKLFPAFLFEFAIGIWLADLFVNNQKTFFKYTLGFKPFLAGVLLRFISVLLTQYGGKEGFAFTNVFTALGFTLIIFNMYFWFSRNSTFKFATEWIGRHSFSIFLLHELFIVIIYNLIKNLHPSQSIELLALFAYSLIILVTAYLFQEYLIKRNVLIRKYFILN